MLSDLTYTVAFLTCGSLVTCAAARRLLRWEQQIIIHAAGGTDIHPDEGKVVLRVHARELADEVGLTAAACKHMLRIAGTKAEGGRWVGVHEHDTVAARPDA